MEIHGDLNCAIAAEMPGGLGLDKSSSLLSVTLD